MVSVRVVPSMKVSTCCTRAFWSCTQAAPVHETIGSSKVHWMIRGGGVEISGAVLADIPDVIFLDIILARIPG